MPTLTRITEKELEREIKNKGDQFRLEKEHENFIFSGGALSSAEAYIIAIFIGMPSGSLCGGERRRLENEKC